jgi:hypothetical protein
MNLRFSVTEQIMKRLALFRFLAPLVTGIVAAMVFATVRAGDQGSANSLATVSQEDLNAYRKEIEQSRAALMEYRKLLDEARTALAEYRKALASQTAKAGDETKKKILEVLANAGLAVAAIFFGFFGFLVGALPGTEDDKVRTIFWWAALATGVGVLIALGTSISAILALGDAVPGAAVWSFGIAIGTALLMTVVTISFITTLFRR